MNYAQIKPCSIENGTGVRVSLFVSDADITAKSVLMRKHGIFSYGKPFTKTEEG